MEGAGISKMRTEIVHIPLRGLYTVKRPGGFQLFCGTQAQSEEKYYLGILGTFYLCILDIIYICNLAYKIVNIKTILLFSLVL